MSSTVQHRESEHKSWFNNLERWNYDLKIWSDYRKTMESDAQAVLNAVDQFLQDVDHQQTSLAELKSRVLDCERSSVEHTPDEGAIVENHAEISRSHNALSDKQIRLEAQRHRLMKILAEMKS